MADSNILIIQADGSQTKVDSRTESTNIENRQVIVHGDPSDNNAVAAVLSSDPSSGTGTYGSIVRIAGSIVIAPGTNSIGAVTPGTGTFTVKFDPGYTLGKVDAGVGTFNVKLDPGYTLGKVDAGVGTFNVQLDPGHTLGNIGSVNSITTTVNVAFSPSTPAVLANTSATIVIPLTVSGQAAGVSVSGNTLISPTTGRAFKIYAFSLTTTGVISVVSKFTNGAGTSPTEFWRVAQQGIGGVSTGANLAVTPPGYLFATAAGSTLSLVLDSAQITHYSVAYFEESS